MNFTLRVLNGPSLLESMKWRVVRSSSSDAFCTGCHPLNRWSKIHNLFCLEQHYVLTEMSDCWSRQTAKKGLEKLIVRFLLAQLYSMIAAVISEILSIFLRDESSRLHLFLKSSFAQMWKTTKQTLIPNFSMIVVHWSQIAMICMSGAFISWEKIYFFQTYPVLADFYSIFRISVPRYRFFICIQRSFVSRSLIDEHISWQSLRIQYF